MTAIADVLCILDYTVGLALWARGRTRKETTTCAEETSSPLQRVPHPPARRAARPPPCTDQEKRDLWNTMLAYEQCRSLFDDGLLRVDNSGTVCGKGGFGPDHPLTV